MLTSFKVQDAVSKEKPYKLSDGDGLHLLVQPSGSKLWRFRYRFASKENMLALGSYPEVSLAAARSKKDEARKLIAEGGDPSQKKKQDRINAAIAGQNTFGAVAGEHLKNLEETNAAVSTMIKNRWLLQDERPGRSENGFQEKLRSARKCRRCSARGADTRLFYTAWARSSLTRCNKFVEI
jgi:hypothetical protein